MESKNPSLKLDVRHTGEFTKEFTDPDEVLEATIRKYENDFDLIIGTPISAPGAKKSRLNSLKDKVDKLAQKIREEQQEIRSKVRESMDGISLQELAIQFIEDQQSTILNEKKQDKRALFLNDIHRRIADLRGKVQNAISEIID